MITIILAFIGVLVIGIFIGGVMATNTSLPYPPYYSGERCSHWDYDMVKARNSRLETENYLLRQETSALRYPYPVSHYCYQRKLKPQTELELLDEIGEYQKRMEKEIKKEISRKIESWGKTLK